MPGSKDSKTAIREEVKSPWKQKFSSRIKPWNDVIPHNSFMTLDEACLTYMKHVEEVLKEMVEAYEKEIEERIASLRGLGE